jgi:diguanylate cyclase (GGDEF)-like protein
VVTLDRREAEPELVRWSFRRGDARSPRWPTLRVVSGEDLLGFLTVTGEGDLFIGRDADCDLVLADASVSRRHVRVARTGDGDLWLEDLGSRNKTTRNGVLVAAPVRLHRGDHVGVGAVSLRLDLLGAAEVAHLERARARLDAVHRDALTGLSTIERLRIDAPGRIGRALTRGGAVSGVLIDVDGFARHNQEHGKDVGDAILRAVSRVVTLGVRERDLVVRSGADELFVLLEADEIGAYTAAARLRMAISHHDWEHHAPGLQVTASLAVCEAQLGEAVAAWVDRGRALVVAARSGGGDRVARASDPARLR